MSDKGKPSIGPSAPSELIEAWGKALEGKDPVAVADHCYSAAVGRSQYDHRLAVTAGDGPALVASLRGAAAGKSAPGTSRGRRALSGVDGPTFVFDGKSCDVTTDRAAFHS